MKRRHNEAKREAQKPRGEEKTVKSDEKRRKRAEMTEKRRRGGERRRPIYPPRVGRRRIPSSICLPPPCL